MSAKAFRELIGVAPSTASTKDSVLIIIDAQNEYVLPPTNVLFQILLVVQEQH